MVQKPYFDQNLKFQNAGVTLKIQCSLQYIYAKLVKIEPPDSVWKWLINSLCRVVTLKIRSRSPKSNQLFPPFQPLVQNIAHRKSILDISKCQCELENYVKDTKI